MKNLSSFAAIQRYAARQDVAWLLDLDLDGETWRAGSRVITVDGQSYPARIAAPPIWKTESATAFGPGGVVAASAELRIADDAQADGSLRSKLEQNAPAGIPAKLRLLWMDAAHTWSGADAVCMLSGVVIQWRNEPAAIVLSLRDKLTAIWEKRVGSVLLPSMLGDSDSPLIGRVMPIVIGRHEQLELLPLRAGTQSRLREALGLSDTVVKLASITGFPATGTAQVGGELVQYTAVDSTENTLGTAARPVVRGQNVMLHSEGEPVRSVPSGGFEWLVADHPCALVEEVEADAIMLPTSDWSTSLRTLGSKQAQIVTMARWPTRLRYEPTPRSRTALEILGPDAYARAGDSTALNPNLAIDTKLTSTAARLAAGAELLAFEISPLLASTGNLLGKWNGASLHLGYSATRRWAAGSQLLLRFTQGGSVYQATIPRPALDEGQGQVEAPPGEEGATVDIPVGIHEFELDLAQAIAPGTGWDAFAASPATQMQVEFVPSADSAEILIHDLSLTISYFAQTTAEEAKSITARVHGWKNEADELVENPADVLNLLLTDERFAGISTDEIDATSLASARSALAAKGFAFARRIAEGPALSGLIEEAARESALWLRMGGPLATFAPAGVTPQLAASVESLAESKALDRAARAQLHNAEGLLTTDILSLVTAASPRSATVVWTRSTEIGQEEGAIPAKKTLRWLDGKSSLALTHLGERLWASLREPVLSYKQFYPLGATILEPGDVATVSQAAIGLATVPCWVESVSLNSASRAELKLRGNWAGEVCWSADGSAFTQIFGFGSRLVVAIAGVSVASIDRFGNLGLLGTLSEEVSLGAGPFSDPITYSGGFVYFGAGTPGAYTSYLRLDSQGNAALSGTLREESGFSFALGAECHGADANGFRLSPRPFTAAAEYEVAGNILHLAGRLIEQTEL